MPNRALVIEGHDLRGELLPYFQQTDLDLIGVASLSDARALLPVLKPAITIVDRELRDGDGLDLVREAVNLGARAIVVSERNATADRVEALSLGALEYLGKPADPQEVFLRVRNLLAAPTALADASAIVREFGGVGVDLSTRTLLRPDGSHADDLTETEFAVLRKLAENADQIVSREEMHVVVTGKTSFERVTRAADTCISRLRTKLRAATAAAEIRSVREAGYLFRRNRAGRSAVG